MEILKTALIPKEERSGDVLVAVPKPFPWRDWGLESGNWHLHNALSGGMA